LRRISVYIRRSSVLPVIKDLRGNPPLVVLVMLLTVILFSSSCDFAGKESAGRLEEKPQTTNEEQNLESNNYQGLRFETTRLEFSNIKDKYPRLVCLGDSVTFGWNIPYEKSYPFLLEERLMGKYPEVMVINSGIGGQTVVDALDRLDGDVLYFEPQVVIINFGLNDAFLVSTGESSINEDKETDLRNNIDLETFKETYKQLIAKISEKSSEILIMGTNPVMAELLWEDKDIAQKQEESYRLYNQATKNIAEAYDLIFIDIRESFTARGELDTFIQPDGVHPNETGLNLISEIISTVLESVDMAGKEEG